MPKSSHARQSADPKWFEDYPWLKADYINGNTINLECAQKNFADRISNTG